MKTAATILAALLASTATPLVAQADSTTGQIDLRVG